MAMVMAGEEGGSPLAMGGEVEETGSMAMVVAASGSKRGEVEEASCKALQKRFDALQAVRSKAVKGKGAWYWTHLEPLLVAEVETGNPKAVKLRCCLCSAVFSASNPSRTASEHLKRGTCPNFKGAVPKALPASSPRLQVQQKRGKQARKRAAPAIAGSPGVGTSGSGSGSRSGSGSGGSGSSRRSGSPKALAVALSGGRGDLGALAQLEKSVRKLKSPGRAQADEKGGAAALAEKEKAVELLAEWLYESCGSVPLGCVEHPKFRAFLAHMGLPTLSRHQLLAQRLETKFAQVRAECEAKLRDAMFFQLSLSHGDCDGAPLLQLSLNLPNGSSLFRCVLGNGKGVEEAVRAGLGGEPAERCVGVVAEAGGKARRAAMAEAEVKQAWMVNLGCQASALGSLLKDMHKHLPLLRAVVRDCLKCGLLFQADPGARAVLARLEAPAQPKLLLLLLPVPSKDPAAMLALMDGVAASGPALRVAAAEEQVAGAAPEVAGLLAGRRFWGDLEAALALVHAVHGMVGEVTAERPIVSQCLPLWLDVRAKVKEWCARYEQEEAEVERVVEKRFRKSYHPAWAAAFVLDPLYLLRDAAGAYLPPFKFLTPDQERDVDRLVTRLVCRDEAHLALRELLHWRTTGLDPLYAQAVQAKELDPASGRMKAVGPQSRRLVWESYLSNLKSLSKVATRLIFLHATAATVPLNNALCRWALGGANSDQAHKILFIAAQAQHQRRHHPSPPPPDSDSPSPL